MTKTPEFVRWALECPCSLRTPIKNWRSPTNTERQLRSLRALGEARVEQRVFEDVAVEDAASPTHGFLVQEIVDAYGEEEMETCHSCVANVARHRGDSALAGCFQLLPKDDWEQATNKLPPLVAEDLPDVAPAWYALWLGSPMPNPIVQLLKHWLVDLPSGIPASVSNFRSAVQTACESELRLHVQLEPQGELRDNRWHIAAHCSRCKMPRDSGEHCPACKLHAKPLAARTRFAKGNRPYWELTRFLGTANAEEFIVRYNRFRESAE